VSEPAQVALTFDAEHPDRSWCPPGAAERILDILAGAGIRATFFVQGRWAEAYPATARRIADEGHLVGNHSHHHARSPLFSDRGLREDVDAARDAIVRATGRDQDAMRHLKRAVALFAGIGEQGTMEPEVWKLVEW